VVRHWRCKQNRGAANGAQQPGWQRDVQLAAVLGTASAGKLPTVSAMSYHQLCHGTRRDAGYMPAMSAMLGIEGMECIPCPLAWW
jgi:hypothetical protein